MPEPIIVDLPDGTEAEFPEGTPLPTIQAAIQKRFPPAVKTQEEPKPSVSLGEITTGEDWQGDPKKLVREGVPLAAGLAGGSVPYVGLLTGPLAYATADLAMGKIMGEQETPETQKQREHTFVAGLATGMAPTAFKAAKAVTEKIVPTPVKQKISETIRYGFDKGVRPTVVGKSNAAQAEKYYDKAETAVKTIIANKPNLEFADDAGQKIIGQLPKNLSQFSQAIDQTKRATFQKYDTIISKSGGSVDLTPIAEELLNYSTNNVVQLSGGTGADTAWKMAQKWNGKRISLTDAQDLIASLNKRLEAFYKNPTPETVTSAAADALAVNNLRSAVDRVVEGSGYQALKNQYGALRGIEKEVANRALVDARRNVKGLLDFTDIYTTAKAIEALSTMSPGTAATAGIMRGIKEYYKYINDPNTQIKKMFIKTDKMLGAVPLKESKNLLSD